MSETIHVLRDYLAASREARFAKERLQQATAAVIRERDSGELGCEKHYIVDGAIVYVAHFESSGPPVQVVAVAEDVVTVERMEVMP